MKVKTEFGRNVLTLMTGTTIAQALPIVTSPILTRIYSPEDFGLLALFVAISVGLSSIASGKYELAIMLPEADEDAINIAALAGLISIGLSSVLCFIVIVFNADIAELLGVEGIGRWLYFIPIVVLMTGFFNVLNYLNTRKKLYVSLARASVYRSVVGVSCQLLLGFFKFGGGGLILGQIISVCVANFKLAKNAFAYYCLNSISWVRLKLLAFRYIDFPKYTVWATLANTLSQNLVSVLIPVIYDIKTLGFYSLVQRVLGVPSSIVGEAIGQVFYQEVARERQETGAGVRSFNETVKKLILIGVPVYTAIYVCIVDVFCIVFGEKWKLAGEYAQILVPLFFIQFVVSTVSIMNSVFLKNKNGLIFQITLLCVSLVLLYVSNAMKLNDKIFFQSLVLMLSLVYIFFGLYLNRLKYGIGLSKSRD